MSCLTNKVSRYSAVWIMASAIDHLGVVSAILGKETQEFGQTICTLLGNLRPELLLCDNEKLLPGVRAVRT